MDITDKIEEISQESAMELLYDSNREANHLDDKKKDKISEGILMQTILYTIENVFDFHRNGTEEELKKLKERSIDYFSKGMDRKIKEYIKNKKH